MKNYAIKKGLDGLSDNDFKDRCQNVVKGLTGNTSFPTPSPTLPVVQIKIDKFALLVQQSKSGNKSPNITLAKNLMKKDIEKDMTSWFKYVNGLGITDITILTSSGFPLAKMPEPIHSIGQCEGFVVNLGPLSGMCTLKVNKLKGAQGYLFQCTETLTPETDNWMTVGSSETRANMQGLTPGVRYTFRVCGLHGQEMGPWSEYIVKFMN